MNDLTILYYTANHTPEHFAQNVRDDLLRVVDDRCDIISISQKPIDFGMNICVGELERCAYHVYHQILCGAYLTMTPFVACCEDDTLYTWEHFTVRPPADTFYYNKSRWILEGRGCYRWRDRTTMCACIAPTELLIDTLDQRFKKYPTLEEGRVRAFGEPGRCEHRLRLPVPKLHYFKTESPIVTFNHEFGLMKPRATHPTDTIKYKLDPWGEPLDLWKRIHG
jgi:hypothetical protein